MTTLYVTDLDGTLLGPDGTVSRTTATTIERLLDEGVLLTCATARSWTTVQRVLGALRFRLPMVLYNGVFTFDAVHGALLDRNVLPGDVVRAVVEACRAADLPPLVYAMDDHGAEQVSWVRGVDNPGIRSFWHDRPSDPRNAPRDRWEDLPTTGVFAVNAIGDAEETEAVAGAIRERVGPACEVRVAPDTYHPDEFWLDVAPAGTSKATAVTALARSVGADRLVVFGDNRNDLSMFAVADEAYAVRNAVDEVLRAATAVIDSNAEDGVARWLAEHAEHAERSAHAERA